MNDEKDYTKAVNFKNVTVGEIFLLYFGGIGFRYLKNTETTAHPVLDNTKIWNGWGTVFIKE